MKNRIKHIWEFAFMMLGVVAVYSFVYCTLTAHAQKPEPVWVNDNPTVDLGKGRVQLLRVWIEQHCVAVLPAGSTNAAVQNSGTWNSHDDKINGAVATRQQNLKLHCQ